MGAYLSEPITEKISSDEANEYLTCGASSMQGWRMSQEDAHNCILDFDENTSFFAVYDGHGGAEVALYCAQKLPNFLKNTDNYRKLNFEQALKETFIGFDATLVLDSVHAELKSLIPADKRDRESEIEEDMDDGEDDIEELAELCQESRMPLNELLEKYKDGKKTLLFQAATEAAKKSDDDSAAGASCSKPYSRGRRTKNSNSGEADGGGGSSGFTVLKASSSEAQPISIRRKLDDDESADGQVSSSSTSSNVKSDKEPTPSTTSSSNEIITSNGPSSSNEVNVNAKDYNRPDSSSAPAVSNQNAESADCSQSSSSSSSEAVKSVANGEAAVQPQENEITTNSSKTEGVSSSSSASSSGSTTTSTSTSSSSGSGSNCNRKPENGEISSNSASTTEKSAVNNISSTNECKAKRNMPILNDDEEDTSSEYEEDASYKDKSSTEDGEDGEDCEMESDEGSDADVDTEEGETDEDDEDDDIFPDDDVDDSFLNDMVEGPGSSSGCTAVVALLVGRNLYVANAGDSRCVVCRNGQALDMSFDHKPEDIKELDRIRKAGGVVSNDGRVNGGLNLSRAIGDHAYKMNKSLGPEEQMISALPDVRKITITDEDEFMVIACDGIWNFMSSSEVVQFVKPKLAEGREKISTICEELFTNCLAEHTLGDGTGCDNMTAVIVQFKPKILEKSAINDEIDNGISNDIELLTAEGNAAAATIDDISRKRLASPDLENESDHKNESDNKRLKTDNDDETSDRNELQLETDGEKVESVGLTSTVDSVETSAATT